MCYTWLQGKANDYLVMNDGAAWPVDCEIFEQSYQLVEDTEDPVEGKR